MIIILYISIYFTFFLKYGIYKKFAVTPVTTLKNTVCKRFSAVTATKKNAVTSRNSRNLQIVYYGKKYKNWKRKDEKRMRRKKNYHWRVKRAYDGSYWLCALIHIGYKQGCYYEYVQKYKTKAEAVLAKAILQMGEM